MEFKKTITHNTDKMEVFLYGDTLNVKFSIEQPGKGLISDVYQRMRSNLDRDCIKLTSNTWDTKCFFFTSDLISSGYVSKHIDNRALRVLQMIHEFFPFNKAEVVTIGEELGLSEATIFEALPKQTPKKDDESKASLLERIEQLATKIKNLEASHLLLETQLKKGSEPTVATNSATFFSAPQ